MRVAYCSDLHIVHGDNLTLKNSMGADVLILAGDILEVNDYKNSSTYKKMFEQISSEFETVFYVMGNHEHWGGYIEKTKDKLNEILPKNFHVLENECVDVLGVRIVGGTLWTDFNRECPITINDARMKMRDYEYIKSSTPVHFWVKNLDGTRTSKTRVGNITPQYVLEAHKTAFEAFSEMVKGSGSVIVVSHHAPTFFSVPEEFKHDSFGNGLYCSDLSDFILDNPQIKKWIHGHIHDTIQYPVGDECEVLANPRGYMGLETLPNRFVLKYFDI